MVVDYIGMERCDILYFILYLGRKLGKSILVADNSLSGDLFRIFKQEGADDQAIINSLVVLRNMLPQKEECQKYDLVLYYEGLDPAYKGARDITILAPSVVKTQWEILQENGLNAADYENSKRYLILRDVTTNKITAEAFANEIGLTDTEGFKQFFSDEDYTNYIGLTHNRAALPISHGEIYDIVIQLAGRIYAQDEKKIKKLMKKDSMDRRRQVW